jgi:hypothetical protein
MLRAYQYFSQIAGGQKPGFFENTSPHIVETAKNPVSLLLVGPETGFFENYSLRLVEVAKNPVSLRLKMNSFEPVYDRLK